MPSRRTTTRLVVAAAIITAVGVAAAAVSARSGGGSTYRTAVAGRHQVEQVLDTVGTVEPVHQASVAFPVAGTVATVDVSVGDDVTVGRRLATLDTAALTEALHQAEATRDQAELTLELALAGEDVGAVTAGSPSGGFGRAVDTGSSSELRDAQQAVLDAQQAVDAALATAEAALDLADQVCATTAEPGAADTTSCQQALADSLAAQQALQVAQDDLVAAADALTALIEDLDPPTDPTEPSEPTTTTSAPTAPATPATPTAPSTSTSPQTAGSPTTSSSSPSAEDLIAYQKAVDAAELAVLVAQQAVDQATIVTPIDGTVVSVGLAVGDAATAASSTQAIVIAGSGGFEVTTSISVADLPDVEVGQEATVLPDGSDTSIDGTVVGIGLAATTSGSTATYPVTIGLTGDTGSLGNGGTASVSITTAASSAVLAVPTSAVSVDGDQASVRRVVDGVATEVDVEVGAVGSRYTEITDGLESGDAVVLADLDEPLPGSATTSSSGQSDGGGQLPGGFSGGGFPPGGGQPPR